MRTNEQRQPAAPAESGDSEPNGLRARLENWLARARRWLRGALGLARGERAKGARTRRALMDGSGAVALRRHRGDEDSDRDDATAATAEVTAEVVDGRLRLSDDDGAYLESDVWERVRR